MQIVCAGVGLGEGDTLELGLGLGDAEGLGEDEGEGEGLGLQVGKVHVVGSHGLPQASCSGGVHWAPQFALSHPPSLTLH